MIIKKATLQHLRLAFLRPFRHNLATHTSSDNLVVKVTTADGLVGYGEGIPRDFVTGETMTASFTFLAQTLLPAVTGKAFPCPKALMAALEDLRHRLPVEQHPAAMCALETALLDAAGKTWNKPVAELLGGATRDNLIYSAVLPMASPQKMGLMFKLVKLQKMQFLKVKVGTPADLEILRLARKELGWDLDLRVDANAAWDADTALLRIREMQPYKISAVEQPVPGWDQEGLRKVSQSVSVPVMADESLCTRQDARTLIDTQACDMFNLRLSKCGGLMNALTIKKMADQAGISCQLGCHVGETSILSAAGRHFALAAGDLAYLEGSFAPYLLTRDTCKPSVTFGQAGRGAPLKGPGLGIQVQDQVLDELTIDRFEL